LKVVTALIFDMDGVIVDSTPIHTEAWNSYLANLGIAVENLAGLMLGKHNHQLVRELFPPHLLTDDMVAKHGAQKEQVFRKLLAPVLAEKLVPGVREFIMSRGSQPLAVATNAERANLDAVLDWAGLRPYFQIVIDGNEVKRPKPFPDIYLRAADMLGYAPEDCIVFEDSKTGVEAANAAGMRVVGVSTTVPEFQDVSLTISDFLDPRLEPWLQAQSISR
jgi:beta-phosphoglucomutase